MLKVKDLKEIIKECKDDDLVSVEYCGGELELERGDRFYDIDKCDVELNKNNLNIVFS